MEPLDRKSNMAQRKIVLIPMVLIVVFTLTAFGVIDHFYRLGTIKQYEKKLIDLAHSGARTLEFLTTTDRFQADLIRLALRESGMPYLPDDFSTIDDHDNFADAFSENSPYRVTIIDIDGKVLGDSQLTRQEVLVIENHGSRPEVLMAKETGVGIAKRFSTTLNIDLLYTAVRYNSIAGKGYFRVALPVIDLNNDITRQRFALGAFCSITLLAGILLNLLMSTYLTNLFKKSRRVLKERIARRTKEIEILQNFSTQLTTCNSSDEALDIIKEVTVKLLPGYSGALALFRASRDCLEVVRTWNGWLPGSAAYSPDQCWALRTGRPNMGDPNNGNIPCSHTINPEDIQFCIPIVAQGTVYGVLHFSGSRAKIWSPEEIQLAYAVSENASLTLANLELRESLHQQAIRDPLTGLYNRRFLIESRQQELSRAQRRNQSLGVLMMDLDHFKRFNDTYGHDAGDFILSEFARLIKATLRSEDIACRYGGEEFAVLLPETDEQGTFRVAEKVRKKIAEHPFQFENRSFGPITISIGAAVFPVAADNAEMLFKVADDALYKAKKNGRDKTVMAETPTPPSPGQPTGQPHLDKLNRVSSDR